MQLSKEWNNFISHKFNSLLTEINSNHRQILKSGNTAFTFRVRNTQIRLSVNLDSLYSITCLIIRLL